MKISIQIKLLVMSTVLVLFAILGISTTYYILTKHDKQREFKDRIQVAFDFFLDAYAERRHSYTQRLDEFIHKNASISSNFYFYQQDASQDIRRAIRVYLFKVAEELQQLGQIIVPDRVLLYGMDKRLLALYSRQGGEEVVGGIIPFNTRQSTFLPLNDAVHGQIVNDDFMIPKTPLPIVVDQNYTGEFPKEISASIIASEHCLGIRVLTPLSSLKRNVGLLVSDIFFDQAFVARYASLSQTDINLFAGEQFSVGTLSLQKRVPFRDNVANVACETVQSQAKDIAITSLQIGEQQYYLGQCDFRNGQEYVGALTVSLARDIEEQAIMQIARAVLLVAGISLLATFAMSVLLSRSSIHSLRNSANVITAVSEGDLRYKAIANTHDEIGWVARKLNQMIDQLRSISTQVQQASYNVNRVADTILREMGDLLDHIERESTLVDNTSESTQKVKEFIDMVAHNTDDLLMAAAQILSSIQEARASISEITANTGELTNNLSRISCSIDQVKQSVRQISDNTGQLENVTRHTEQEIHQIERTLNDVSHNAERTQELAQETMHTATSGQSSVDASIQGMQELKEVVANSAQIIREVRSWGERVSSILDIVNEITEQTSLLALNASIISAQAGVHGRGFAVVANEIKELAIRTRTSTGEIGTLVRELQKKSEEGVVKTEEGLKKADHGVQLVSAVKDALTIILESATRSSNRAADTAQLVQQTTVSGQSIHAQMNNVTQMVSNIRIALQEEETDIEEVMAAVENISGMAELVNRANLEQRRAAEDIDQRMSDITDQFGSISEQTGTLQHDVDQIAEAMQAIELTTEHISQNTTAISGESVKHLIQQSENLQKIVHIFKVS